MASWYKPGETYDSVFSGFSSALEECKAESVGLYLCLDQRVYPIFGHTDATTVSDIIYINWLSMVREHGLARAQGKGAGKGRRARARGQGARA